MLRVWTDVITEGNCDNCEFNFGLVCAGYGVLPDGSYTYGQDMESVKKVFPDGCGDWELSLSGYEDYMDNTEKRYEVAVELYQFLIDYGKKNNISSISEIKDKIKSDDTIDQNMKEVYITRLDTISSKAKAIFRRNGIV